MSDAPHLDDLGLQPVGFEGDVYVVALDIETRHLNISGIVHGGVLCSLLDTAMARAYFMGETGREFPAVTLEMKVNFLGSAKEGRLLARGRVVQRTRRTAYVEGTVEDEQGRTLSRATSTIIVLEDGDPRAD